MQKGELGSRDQNFTESLVVLKESATQRQSAVKTELKHCFQKKR
ncbi:hypothetical protein [uncultured Ligilactobacillus sp.]|nr:hypothetical protein [uncultured Ligilactobacillus sp.]